MKKTLTIIAAAMFCLQASAQLKVEDFNYGSVSDTLTNSLIGGADWKRHSGTGSPLPYLTGSLTFPNYNTSGLGGSTSFTNGSGSREDANFTIPGATSSGTVYAACLIKVTNSGGTTPEYSIHLSDQSGTAGVTNLRARVAIKDGSTPGTFKLGLSKSAAAASSVFSTTDYNLNQVYALVIKYIFISGTGNDSVYAYIIENAMPANQPALPTITAADVTANDLAALATFCIRQGTGNTSSAQVDGIIVGTSWAHLISSSVQAPTPVSNLSLIGVTKSTAEVSWNYPTVYSDTTTTILVFAKKDSAITAGTPTLSQAAYSANNNLSNPGSTYQNDPLAFCVYKGDGSGFTLTGMQEGATYHLLTYIVSDADSLYSTGVSTSGTASARPPRISGLEVTKMGQTNMLVKWTKPSAYNDASYTTLVFMKPDSAITGTPMQNWAATYLANSNYSDTSSALETDKLAKCVLNSDSNTINVSGLVAGTTYYVAVYTFREADSTYSLPENGSVTTEGLFPEPQPIQSPSASEIADNTFKLQWSKDSTYVDSLYTTLVFARASSAIATGANTFAPSVYTDAPTFGDGTPYQNDSAAFCIYKGDSTTATLLNATELTTYHLLFYAVRDSDNVYSSPTNLQVTTIETPPAPATAVNVTGTSQLTARVEWTKPISYPNNRYSVLVFMKAGAINSGTVNKGITAYQANPSLGLGSTFDTDSNAYCVYKGDTTFVNVSGLNPQTQYEVAVFIMRDLDSVESTRATATGSTQGPPPMYSIGSINTTHPTTGVADSTGVRVTVEGTVYGFNQRATGLQLLLKDSTGGITLFHASKNFGYTVAQGDKLQAEGVITTFRGLNQITLDTIRWISSGNQVASPRKVQTLSENTENDLVKLDSVRFLSAPTGGVWPSVSTNIRVISPANDTLTVRVLSTSALAGKPLPATPTFNIAGMGSQNTTTASAPFPFSGYQLLPRTESDVTDIIEIAIDSLSPFFLLTPGNEDTIIINASNLTDTVTIRWSQSIHSNGVDPTNYTFILDTLGGDFGNPYDEIDNAADTTLIITKQDIVDLVIDPLQIPPGGWFAGSWQVRATAGSVVRNAEQTFSVYILSNLNTGIAEQLRNQNITLSPNPAHGYTRIGGLEQGDAIELLDATGRILLNKPATESELTIPTLDLNSGIYFVRIQNNGASIIRKLIIQ